eukprot:1391065-Pleurochrysis_carterae.AAC.1
MGTIARRGVIDACTWVKAAVGRARIAKERSEATESVAFSSAPIDAAAYYRYFGIPSETGTAGEKADNCNGRCVSLHKRFNLVKVQCKPLFELKSARLGRRMGREECGAESSAGGVSDVKETRRVLAQKELFR